MLADQANLRRRRVETARKSPSSLPSATVSRNIHSMEAGVGESPSMRKIVAVTTFVGALAAAGGASGQGLTPTAPPPLAPTAPTPVAPTAPPPLRPTTPTPVATPAPSNTGGAVTTLGTFSVGNWSAGAYTAPGLMTFDHCAAEVQYQNGVTLGFAVTRDYQWSMAFYDPNWQLTPGASYPISFTIDYSQPSTATAIAFDVSAVDVPLAPDASLFRRFMDGERLRVVAAEESFDFNLTDTSQMLPDLLNCVRSYVGAAPPTANPFQSFTR
jgi:hypothetical protein